jgi:hypothetical protein
MRSVTHEYGSFKIVRPGKFVYVDGTTRPAAELELTPKLTPQSRRDGPIVAWHEVPGTARPQKCRPVGYGLIRAGTRTDSTIGVTSLP